MKPREVRRKVLIRARLRAGGDWVDATIHNVSSRGLLIETTEPAERGDYIEIRRGRFIIIGRAMWRQGLRFGVRAQDRLPIEALLSEPNARDRTSASAEGAPMLVERRAHDRRKAAERIEARAARSRSLASAMQLGAITLAGFAGSAFLATKVYQLLAGPARAIISALP